MTHCFLQILVNPNTGEDLLGLQRRHWAFTAKTYHPRLGRVKKRRHSTPYGPVLLYRVHIHWELGTGNWELGTGN